MKIKEWAEEDRPREKMLLKGIASLSDAELLAILIGSLALRSSPRRAMDRTDKPFFFCHRKSQNQSGRDKRDLCRPAYHPESCDQRPCNRHYTLP